MARLSNSCKVLKHVRIPTINSSSKIPKFITKFQTSNHRKITNLKMHAYCDASVSAVTTKSHFSFLPALASSRVSFIRNVPNRKLGCLRAVKNGSIRSDMTFYEVLGVAETGSLPEIKQAYKQLALKYHPDVSPAERVEEYTQRFIRVQEAYETLSDPMMRAVYDTDMAKGLQLGFSTRKVNRFDEETTSDWKNRWQSQLSELKRRSMEKELFNCS